MLGLWYITLYCRSGNFLCNYIFMGRLNHENRKNTKYFTLNDHYGQYIFVHGFHSTASYFVQDGLIFDTNK